MPLDPTEPAYPQVSRGVAWLDENHKGWAGRIDPDRLNVGSVDSCVLCQVYGFKDFFLAAEEIFDDPYGLDITQELGFISGGVMDGWFASADRLWKQAAAERVARGEVGG